MVISYCLRAGGAETVINNLCNGLRKIGYNIAIGAIFFLPNPPDNIEKANRRNLEVSHLTILVDIILILFIIIIQHELLFTANIKTFCISLSRIINRKQEINLKMSILLCRNRLLRIISISNAVLNL